MMWFKRKSRDIPPPQNGEMYWVDWNGWNWRVLKWQPFLADEEWRGCYNLLYPATAYVETLDQCEAWIKRDIDDKYDWDNWPHGKAGSEYRKITYSATGEQAADVNVR